MPQVETCITEIKNEIALIEELIQSHDELIQKANVSTPSRIEISAAATVLHSFYNGVENIFERIANRLDEKLPSTSFWHQELLEQMTTGNQYRQPVISANLYETLRLYLGFRHFFRHSYAFQFKWDKLKDLLLDLTDTFSQFKDEIDIFIKKI